MGNPGATRVKAPDRLLAPMRAALFAAVLVLPALAGCVAVPGADVVQPAAVLDPAGVDVPPGATLVQDDPRGLVLRFADVKLPFETKVTVPAGATLVRAVAIVAKDLTVGATMWSEETGRRRCNTDYLDAWDLPIRGVAQCSGLAAIDPPGARWAVRASGPAGTVATVEVVFETTPLDGLAAKLDLSQLSMPVHDLLPTEYLLVESFDGTPLWVEVTLPEGEGPWPTVLASSPYNGQAGRGEEPAMWEYFTHDWARRGYAVVNADVRGFGMSGGCVEVWGENEQKDQAFLVDWVAQQPWSDGNVGFYGQSYVGTTPVAAAVQAPEALKAIIAVAPVINAYFDWHFGGVPNGENTLSPVAYQVLTDSPLTQDLTDPAKLVEYNSKGLCDPTLMARANDPRAVYDAFYEERNFSARAAEVRAAVLYTQGFEDSNVKSAMIPGWFNAITAPKLGVFGHWVHQHPTRADEEVMFLGWMDQYVKGKPLGFDALDPVEVVVDDGSHRTAQAWPPTDARDLALLADFAGGRLAPDAKGSDVDMLIGTPGPTQGGYTMEHEVPEDVALAGIARLATTLTLRTGGNAWLYAELHDVAPDGSSALMTYGMFNVAHREGYDTFTPTAPMEKVTVELPFLPTEHVFREGHAIRLVVRGVAPEDVAGGGAPQPGVVTLHGGEATRLLLPTIDPALYAPAPATATR